MGQTLTHGVYLPDEGERNCYSGLAANWQILDGSVGTIAAHTAALAGKAPAVHTHTKADITDFPAYGTTAGTICEGNDSRLSDARTPVAHVHGNITNDGKLTNGNRAVITGSDKTITESSVTDTELGYLAGVTSAIQTQLNAKANDSGVVHKTGKESIAGDKTFSGQNIYTAVTYGNKVVLKNTGLDLSNGNSGLTDTYLHFIQWVDNSDTVYAMLQGFTKSANTTTVISNKYKTDANTSVTAELRLENSGTAKSFYSNSDGDTALGTSAKQWTSVYAQSYYYNGTAWGLDKANVWTEANTFQSNIYHKSGISTLVKGTNPSSVAYYGAFRHQTYAGDEINLFRGYIGTTGDNCFRWSIEPWVSGSNGRFQMRVSSDGSVRAFEVDGTEVSPYTGNATDLGTSTKRWKTLNGINPGALSLPDMSSGTGVSLSAGSNSYSPPSSGWLSINLTGVISVVCGNFCHSGTDMLSVPVVKGSTYTVTVATSGTAYLFVSQGNV